MQRLLLRIKICWLIFKLSDRSRVGQLICDATQADPFYIEDGALLGRLEELRGR